jgi:hypothetical protein
MSRLSAGRANCEPDRKAKKRSPASALFFDGDEEHIKRKKKGTPSKNTSNVSFSSPHKQPEPFLHKKEKG